MSKRDYLDDPDAPKANSLVVAVGVIAKDDDGSVLLIRRTDNGLWALPGGAQELGEDVKTAAVRECEEETGVVVEITGLSGIYSNPHHVIAYDNGEVRQEFSIVFGARPIGGAIRSSGESKEVRWGPPKEISSYAFSAPMLMRVRHGFENANVPYLG